MRTRTIVVGGFAPDRFTRGGGTDKRNASTRCRSTAVPVAFGLVLLGAVASCGEEGSAVVADCGFADAEPNNAPGGATTQALDTPTMGCLGSGDVDHIRIEAPADPAGGYVEARVTDVVGGTVRVRILDAAGGTEVGSAVATAPGEPVTVFVAVGPGQDARIALHDESGNAAPYAYTLTATYHAVPDMFEPNDARESATGMAMGAPIDAYLFSGKRGGDASFEAYNDYYRFTPSGGSITVTMENVPSNLAARLFLYGPDGGEVARVSSGLKGGALTMQPPVTLSPAEHTLLVTVWTDMPASFGTGDAIPEHFVKPYRLTVLQP